MTITEFLEARIAEDETVARDRPSSAHVHVSGCYYYNYSLDAGWECDCDDDGSAQHRLLAECAAKRAIITEHATREVASLDRDTWARVVTVCRVCALGPRQVVSPCPTLRTLAAVYAGHEDYQQGWAL